MKKIISLISGFFILLFTLVMILLGAIFIAFNFLFIELPYRLFTYRKRKRDNEAYRLKKAAEAEQRQQELERHERALQSAADEMERRLDPRLEEICLAFDKALTETLYNERFVSAEAANTSREEGFRILKVHGDELRAYLEPLRSFAGAKGKPKFLKNHHWRLAYNAFLPAEKA